MGWNEKYAECVTNLNRLETGLAAILMATSNILRKEGVDYTMDILGGFCKFFLHRDKTLMLEQLQRFAENGWFTNYEIDHISILKRVVIDVETKLIEATCAQRRKDC